MTDYAGQFNPGFRLDPARVALVVVDDGVGIAPSGRRSGLANLAARAGALGGECTAEPGEGRGTRLVWRVPLHA